MNWSQMISFGYYEGYGILPGGTKSYFNIGHNLNSDLYRIIGGKIETAKSKKPRGKRGNTHPEQWGVGPGRGDYHGRIDHTQKKISLNTRPELQHNERAKEYATKMLSDKYPDYEIVHFSATEVLCPLCNNQLDSTPNKGMNHTYHCSGCGNAWADDSFSGRHGATKLEHDVQNSDQWKEWLANNQNKGQAYWGEMFKKMKLRTDPEGLHS